MKAFGDNLNGVIKAKRYSLKEVSEATSIPRSTLAEWVQGRSPQLGPELLKLSSFLGVSLEYLMTGKEDSTNAVETLLRKAEIHTGRYEITIRKIGE